MRYQYTIPAHLSTDIMLYLEDYLEMIEQLHHDLRDQFTVMREMDLSVQNDYDRVQQDIKVFCEKARSMTKTEWSREQVPILSNFKRIIETADEKVALSTQLHDVVSRYLQKLEKELAKFKAELENDNQGITEVLEQMAMVIEETDTTPDSPKNIKKKTLNNFNDSSAFDALSDYDVDTTGLDSMDDYRMLYDDINTQSNSPQSVTSELSDSISVRKRKRADDVSTSAAISMENNNGTNPLVKKKRPAVTGPGSALVTTVTTPSTTSTNCNSGSSTTTTNNSNNNVNRLNKKLEYQTSQEVFEVDWQHVDPNEPRYCICNQVSYGEMVGCDNPTCPIEWFHYPCVGLQDAPKGKWYCPQCCNESLKRKK